MSTVKLGKMIDCDIAEKEEKQKKKKPSKEEVKAEAVQTNKASFTAINPEKIAIDSKGLHWNDPLMQHIGPRMHNLDAQLLKKPRFSM